MTTISAPTRANSTRLSPGIEVFRPDVGEAEIQAVADVLRSGWIGRGEQVAAFEHEWAAHIGVPTENVVSLNCATEALFQVMNWLSFQKPQTVIMPANSYIGTANAARAAGLFIELCDIDAHTLNPTIDHLNASLTADTLAVVVQHYGGVPGEQGAIESLCAKSGVYLIEDCACAPDSMFYGMPAGIGGDFGIWSFDAMKVLTAADGAMLYCRDADVAAEIRRATLLGQDTASGRESGGERWWEFTVAQPGRRAIMNDVQAAIGRVQLARLGEMVNRRRALWDNYQNALAALDWLTLPPEPPVGVQSSYYTYWVQCERRDDLARYLRERGIYTTYRYWPVNQAYGWAGEYPGSDWAAAHTLNLPLYPSLRDSEQDAVCDAIGAFGRTLSPDREGDYT